MKRNIDLIRQILLILEEDDSQFLLHDGSHNGIDIDCRIEDESPFVLSYHVLILRDAGFIETASLATTRYDCTPRILRLTWKGHDYLDSIREAASPEKAGPSFKVGDPVTLSDAASEERSNKKLRGFVSRVDMKARQPITVMWIGDALTPHYNAAIPMDYCPDELAHAGKS